METAIPSLCSAAIQLKIVPSWGSILEERPLFMVVMWAGDFDAFSFNFGSIRY